MLERLGDLRPHLAGADLALKPRCYRDLGVRLDWQPETDQAFVEIAPRSTGESVEGPIPTLGRAVLYQGWIDLAA